MNAFFETRAARLARLTRERQRTQTARELRDRQAHTYAALGASALIPSGSARSRKLYHR